MAQQDFASKKVLGGYQIDVNRALRPGTICSVYKGIHKFDGHIAAIKVLNKQYEQQGFAQFKEEIRILRYLSQSYHDKHFVEWKHTNQEDGYWFFVMDYISDNSLLEIIKSFSGSEDSKKKTSLEHIEQIVKYVQQGAEALQYAHNQGIIHCDIKPEHMLLKNGNIVLCDFGLAVQLSLQNLEEQKPLQPLSKITRIGDYMAPEQRKQKEQKPYQCRRSDQYALGLVALELLRGKLSPPISSDSIRQVLLEWTKQDPSVGRIVYVLETALSEDPQERYDTIKKFADELQKEATKVIKDQVHRSSALDLSPSYDNSQVTSTSPAASSIPSMALSGSTYSLPPQGIKQNVSNLPAPKTKLSRRKLLMELAPLGVLGGSLAGMWPNLGSLFFPPTQSGGRPASNKKLGNIYSVYHGHTNNVNGVSWSPDNTQIASASFDHTIQIWDATDGLYHKTLVGHTEKVNDVAWSPKQGNYIASCSGETHGHDLTVRLWNVSNGRSITDPLRGHQDVVNAVAWSPDGTMIASASFDHTVIVWDVSGTMLFSYKGHKSAVYAVAWSPDGKYIASCSTRTENEVHIWDATTGKNTIIVYAGHTDDVLSISWISIRNNTFIASGSKDESVHIWSPSLTDRDYRDGPDINLNAPVSKVSWSPKGELIAASTRSGNVYVWNATKDIVDPNRPTYIEKNQNIFGTSNGNVSINALAWSPDGTMIATGGSDSSVQVWSSV